MKYSAIKNCDIANGTGVRVSLFVSGCNHHCKGCFNSEAWDFDHGEDYTIDTRNNILKMLEPDYINGLSLLGGEPLDPLNVLEVYELVCEFRHKFKNSKDIWLYTGYTWEELKGRLYKVKSITDKDWSITNSVYYYLLSNIDILVDGRFIEEEKDISLVFRGSRNQRIIKCRETIKENKIENPIILNL